MAQHETFWILDEPDTPDADTKLASWSEDEPIDFEKIDCAVDPDHRGVRNRITSPLSVTLPNVDPQDFVWTHLGECLVQEHVVDLFTDWHFKGYEMVRAKVAFRNQAGNPPPLWELVVRGSAGLASPQSGLQVLRKCPGCGLTDYSPIIDPTKVVDESNWDRSDFFKVKALEGWIFVTSRVVEALRSTPVTGWRARSLRDMKSSFDIAIPARQT